MFYQVSLKCPYALTSDPDIKVKTGIMLRWLGLDKQEGLGKTGKPSYGQFTIKCEVILPCEIVKNVQDSFSWLFK